MYLITKTNGVKVALTDNPVYIRVSDNGSLNLADENTAQGIAYNGMPYNLFGHTEIPDAETVLVIKTDGGAVLEDTRCSADDNTEMIIDMQYQIDINNLGGI